MKQILVIDDEIAIVDALRHQLHREGFTTLHGASAAEGLILFRKNLEIALVVLDIGLPDQTGFSLFRQLQNIRLVPILFLTARSEEIDKIVGLELGADDYITKPFSPREVVARIKNIVKRNDTSSNNEPNHAKFFVDSEQKIIFFEKKPLQLSRYEFLILQLLLKRPGKVFSREEIMARVWESPEMSLERTIDTHIKTLRAKLREINADEDLIITHRGFGYSIREML